MIHAPQAREIGEHLIDGVFFHIRRETPKDVVKASGHEAVGLIIAGEEHCVRAEFFDL